MTHYSDNPAMMRVDYFKPSGKWYMTEAVEMPDGEYAGSFIFDAIHAAVDNHWAKTRGPLRHQAWRQFTIVVLEPYHQNAYPIMIKAEEKDE